MKSLSCVRLLATPWTAAYKAPLSVGFSRQEYWSGVPLPSPARSRRTPGMQDKNEPEQRTGGEKVLGRRTDWRCERTLNIMTQQYLSQRAEKISIMSRDWKKNIEK